MRSGSACRQDLCCSQPAQTLVMELSELLCGLVLGQFWGQLVYCLLQLLMLTFTAGKVHVCLVYIVRSAMVGSLIQTSKYELKVKSGNESVNSQQSAVNSQQSTTM